MDLSVIIVNYNTSQLLGQCLSSLLKNKDSVEKEIIVVDNASSDDSVNLVRSLYPSVKLIESSSNLGFARGNNMGFKRSTGDFLLFMNPDTVVLDGSLENMGNYLRNNDTCGCLGPKLVYPDGTLQLSSRKFLNVRTILMRRLPLLKDIAENSKLNSDYLMKVSCHDSIEEIDWLLGACIMIRRDVFDKIGGWDERYRLYFEDVDLCYRLKKAGFKNIYFPEATVVHHHQRDSAKKFSRKTLWHIQSAIKYFNKHGWTF